MRGAPKPTARHQERVLKLRLELTLDDRVTLFDDQIIATLLQVLERADTQGDLLPGIAHPGPGERLRGVDIDVIGIARRPASGPIFAPSALLFAEKKGAVGLDANLDTQAVMLGLAYEEMQTTTMAVRALMSRFIAFDEARFAKRMTDADRMRLLKEGHALMIEANELLHPDDDDAEDDDDSDPEPDADA